MRLLRWILPALLLVAAVAGASAALTEPDPSAPDVTGSQARARPPEAPTGSESAPPEVRRARPADSVRAPEAPRRVTLPGGAVVPVRAVGTRPDGRLAVPRSVAQAGWWRGGSRLGDPFGATLVAAHIDSTTRGLGPFAGLLTVRAGDRVVLGSRSLRQEHRVESLRLIPQGSLADRAGLHSPRGPRRLVLVTCAPPYDRARGGYQHLAVVTARPVGPPVHTGRP
ncbi:class F sortase [Nocardioides donggukensis]|uniref:Class F sortase n=1 Tax=Nocardioides donggukensis TaxID=2774019 RepID=A0A927K3V8_9ACTN|nr:class F sortase [Nocardioides donggukensis]MBD8869587.1 class F sortase [Nocardioides donggukensis]